jgi:pseudouridine-5'-phosphate glycosidase/pseudouridine kinase
MDETASLVGKESPEISTEPDIIVAGALAVDYSCDFRPLPGSESNGFPALHTSNPATISQSLGGVGHNIASAAHFLGRNVSFCSIVGDDLPGRTATGLVGSRGINTEHIYRKSKAWTAQYVAVNDIKKDLVLAMADMGILEHVSPDIRQAWLEFIERSKPKWFVADANFDSDTLLALYRAAKAVGTQTAFEPVSTAKSLRLLSVGLQLPVYPNHLIDLTTPNALELASMHSNARSSAMFDRQDWWSVVDALGIPSSGGRRRLTQLTSSELVDQGLPQQCIQLLPFIPAIVTKLGSRGVILAMLLHKDDKRLKDHESDSFILSRSKFEDPHSPVGGVYMRYFPTTAIADEEIVSVNGVGDTFLGALISENIAAGGELERAIDFAQSAAAMTLRSTEAVSPELVRLKNDDREDLDP